MRRRAFSFQLAKQGLRGGMRDGFGEVQSVGDFSRRRFPALPKNLHDLKLDSAQVGSCFRHVYLRLLW